MEIGERMKGYEKVADTVLTRRMPYIIRVDGKSFHTWTHRVGAQKPYDARLSSIFEEAASYTLQEMSGGIAAYLQSDEVSFLLQDYWRLDTDPWFGKRIQKLCSITASMFTAFFNAAAAHDFPKPAFFDARAFVLPFAEVINYFVWRQQDATRNSIQALGQHYFSHKALHGLSNEVVQEKLWQEYGVNWNDLPPSQKRGTMIFRDFSTGTWFVDYATPVFTQDRSYFQRFAPELVGGDQGIITGD